MKINSTSHAYKSTIIKLCQTHFDHEIVLTIIIKLVNEFLESLGRFGCCGWRRGATPVQVINVVHQYVLPLPWPALKHQVAPVILRQIIQRNSKKNLPTVESLCSRHHCPHT